ncbi:MAG: nuclear transport factor 2 family protein [Pseudomonadota bacterium]|nr:nuclear transport factor 2 family protein [Pseudomonadota bacterium]
MNQTFSERFAQAWREPTPQKLAELLAEDVVLYQPHLPPIRGKAAAVAEFTRLFEWLPGTFSETRNSRENEELALIEHVLHFPVGKSYIKVPAVDRFILKDGLANERVVYFDQIRLISGVIRHPGTWLGFVKYRLGAAR